MKMRVMMRVMMRMSPISENSSQENEVGVGCVGEWLDRC